MSKPTFPPTAAAVVLERGVRWNSLQTLLGLSTSRMLRGRRLWILSFLFLLPTFFTVLAQTYARRYEPGQAEAAFVFGMIPQALVPLASLVYASGIVQDELEEQTMTYLLMRPIPRWMIYATKLVATVVVTAALCSIGTAICLATAHRFIFGEGGLPPQRMLTISGLMSLTIAAYCALFGLMSLLVRRALVLGILYIIFFEGVLANIDFVLRKLTVVYYFRVMTIRWLDQKAETFSVDLATAPSAWESVATLAVAATAFVALAAWIFDGREFRVKTPD